MIVPNKPPVMNNAPAISASAIGKPPAASTVGNQLIRK
jgi:hypothetical protein